MSLLLSGMQISKLDQLLKFLTD